jgi:hypothetical protein
MPGKMIIATEMAAEIMERTFHIDPSLMEQSREIIEENNDKMTTCFPHLCTRK